MKINFHRVLLGFFENWDKSPQKKWDKGGLRQKVDQGGGYMILSTCKIARIYSYQQEGVKK